MFVIDPRVVSLNDNFRAKLSAGDTTASERAGSDTDSPASVEACAF
jgi:hypothetical protein